MIHVFTMGYLGSDPQKKDANGKTLWSFTLGVTNAKKETTWMKVTHWGENSFIEKFLKKGSCVIVTGYLNPVHVSTDGEGKTRANLNMTMTHISFGPKKEEPKQESIYQGDYKLDPSTQPLPWEPPF